MPPPWLHCTHARIVRSRGRKGSPHNALMSLRSLSRKLAARGLSVAILRVMDRTAELKPLVKR